MYLVQAILSLILASHVVKYSFEMLPFLFVSLLETGEQNRHFVPVLPRYDSIFVVVEKGDMRFHLSFPKFGHPTTKYNLILT